MTKTHIAATLAAVFLALGLFQTFSTSPNGPEGVPSHVHTLYSKWCVKYGKINPTPAEHTYRLSNFFKNYKTVSILREQQPTAEFVLNYMADMSNEEFHANKNGLLEEEEEVANNGQAAEPVRPVRPKNPGYRATPEQKEKYNEDYENYRKKMMVFQEDAKRKQYEERLAQNMASLTEEQRTKMKNDKAKQIKKHTQIRDNKKAEREERIAKLTLNEKGEYVVTTQRKVGSQGRCGSCWAWAAKHILQDFFKGTVEVSAQHLVDCHVSKTCPAGCNGASSFGGLHTAIMLDNGIVPEASYPYEAIQKKCRIKEKKADLKSVNARPVQLIYQSVGFVEQALEEIIERQMSVGLGVTSNSLFKFYKSGILDTSQPGCKDFINHAVALYGFKKDEYLMLRNSWGEQWGENGTMRLGLRKEMTYDNGCFCGRSRNCGRGSTLRRLS